VGYVLGIRASDHLEVASGAGRLPARALTGHLEAAGWLRLSPTVAVCALLLVVGAPSGGLMASSPDRPGEGERRVDRWAPDQAGAGGGQERQGRHGQGDVPVPGWILADLVVIETDFALGLLEGFLNLPCRMRL
jgi:hypothetical protein